jgi:hypothetical protein
LRTAEDGFEPPALERDGSTHTKSRHVSRRARVRCSSTLDLRRDGSGRLWK